MARPFFAAFDKRSLCLILECLPDGKFRALGSGCFFMKRDIVLTAKHVLSDVLAERRPFFITNGSADGKLFQARPMEAFQHPEIDLTLVRVATDGLQIDHPLFP